MFLGLTLLKFGNPVVLDSKVSAPKNLAEFWFYAWPPGWSVWFLLPLALIVAVFVLRNKPRWPGSKWLWVLPLIWFGWQLVSATRTVDGELTQSTILHFAGLLVSYFAGALIFQNERLLRWLLIGLLAAFAFCLVRAVDQKLIEFPSEKQFLIQSEQAGWTNLPPEVFLELKQSGTIVTTNGVDIANPIILKKYEKSRVFGTLVYPNALAGAILILFPVSMVLAFGSTRKLRPLIRYAAIGLTLFLGLGALFWTGSKSGWLIALALLGIWLFRLNWPSRLKWITLLLLIAVGLTAFGIRFRGYFAAGATSVGARFDYWRAAVQTTRTHPFFGTGPGTFQHPYAQIKTPEAEMARLTHNDYLEQFSDSGVIGGIAYAAWIGLLFITLGSRLWKSASGWTFAIFLGCLGWFVQGLSEFSLYVPALAWTAFLLAGSLLAVVDSGNQIDNLLRRR